MAGGTFTAYNKVRPGAYINFKAVPRPTMQVGDRGICTTAIECNWGEEGKLIDILSSDLFDGNYRKKLGNTDSLICELMLQNAYKALIYRLNTGGEKATATVSTLTATANYTGTFGNSLKVGITAVGDSFDVITYIDTEMVDKQRITAISDLVKNDYVTFSGTGTLLETVATSLTGGTNGTVTASTGYQNYFNLLKTAKWQTLAITNNHDVANPLAVSLIKNLREDNGKYVQATLKSDADDYEGIIKSKQGYEAPNYTVSADIFPAWVAGATAGASITDNNTGKVVYDAMSIIGAETNEEIIEDLLNGYFLISENAEGNVKVEQDINSLHTYLGDNKGKSYAFSKNRVIRTLDEIGNTAKYTFEKTYMGAVSNDEIGRKSYKADLINYFNMLMTMRAVQNFDSATDIEVLKGPEINDVIVNSWIQPVDSMEKVYMTVNVRG